MATEDNAKTKRQRKQTLAQCKKELSNGSSYLRMEWAIIRGSEHPSTGKKDSKNLRAGKDLRSHLCQHLPEVLQYLFCNIPNK